MICCTKETQTACYEAYTGRLEALAEAQRVEEFNADAAQAYEVVLIGGSLVAVAILLCCVLVLFCNKRRGLYRRRLLVRAEVTLTEQNMLGLESEDEAGEPKTKTETVKEAAAEARRADREA